jgi:hypothetical protein
MKNIKDLFQKMVKEDGWELAKIRVSEKHLVKLGFNNDPMEFLNMYNDLDIIPNKVFKRLELPTIIYFKNKTGDNIGVYDLINNQIYINFVKIWNILRVSFKLNHEETQELIKIWIDNNYNIKNVKVSEECELINYMVKDVD